MADATFVCVAYFVASKQGKTGLADTTFDIDQIDPATSAMTTYLTAQAGTEVRNGIYRRFFTGDDAMMYEFVAKTADATVDQQWLAGVAVLLNRLERLDADVSSRATQADILSDATPFPGANIDAAITSRAQPSDAMALTADYDAAKTAAAAGAAMTLTSGERTTLAGVLWGVLTSALTAAGSIGKYIVDYLAGIKAKTDLLGTTTVAVVSPVRENGDVEIVRGDVYEDADGRMLIWESDAWNIGEYSDVIIVLQNIAALIGVRLSATRVGLELSHAQSVALPAGVCAFSIQEIQGDGDPITLLRSRWVTHLYPEPRPA